MKKTSIFFALIFCLFAKLNAQIELDKFIITPVQAGTISLFASKSTTVALSNEVKEMMQQNSNSYYVVFTPIGNLVQPKILDKNNQSFSAEAYFIDSKSALAQVSVDYIVFIKRKLNPANTIKKTISQ